MNVLMTNHIISLLPETVSTNIQASLYERLLASGQSYVLPKSRTVIITP